MGTHDCWDDKRHESLECLADVKVAMISTHQFWSHKQRHGLTRENDCQKNGFGPVNGKPKPPEDAIF
jgi:hypothetical protein